MSDNEKLKKMMTQILMSDPLFIQSMKDFEALGFIEITKEGIKIKDIQKLKEYGENFGKMPEVLKETKH
tara:strand:+ start:277 stop:483 length:207 start_codon:yes stop_codon:yes gene_type:complete